MAGYVAMARVEGSGVRALGLTSRPPSDEPTGTDEPVGVVAAALEPDDGITLGEQWERLRDQLAMVTFYLTDPESWR